MTQEEKRRAESRERHRQAVKEKMESASNLAESYRKMYEGGGHSEEEKEAHRERKNRRKIKGRIISSIYQTVIMVGIFLIAFVMVYLPLKSRIEAKISQYFSSAAPVFDSHKIENVFEGSDLTEGVFFSKDVVIPQMNCCYGQMTSEDFKLETDVIMGVNSTSLINGAGQFTSSILPGYGGPMVFYGYNTGCFRNLNKAEKNDIITFTTNYGVFAYKVVESGVFNREEEAPYNEKDFAGEKLVLCTDYPFNLLDDSKKGTFYLICEKKSGPEVAF